jgi:hypothetical protein
VNILSLAPGGVLIGVCSNGGLLRLDHPLLQPHEELDEAPSSNGKTCLLQRHCLLERVPGGMSSNSSMLWRDLTVAFS